ncbi:MAG: TetR/AcrR family transcriptional regulator [bacterium]|nr:TetR/AcrR family transcriptional regulator [bacterium]
MARPQPAALQPKDDDSAPKPKGEKRDRILEAAIVVFARKGFHKARISDISAEAEIAYGLVYHYFKNKDEILATIFDERWGGLLEALHAIGRGPGTVRNQLVSIATLILNAFRLRPDWVKVLVIEIQRSSRFAEPAQQQAVGSLFSAFEGILIGAKERGELREDLDVRVAAALFLGAVDLVITSLVIGVAEAPEDDAAQRAFYLETAHQIVDIFLRGSAGSEETS